MNYRRGPQCSAILLLLTLAIPQFGQVTSLATVKKIKLGSMGQSDEAERFRLLLDDELGKVGFTITETTDSADAILTGVLSVRVYADESLARVTVVLKTPDGKRLWGKDFEPHLRLRGPRDTVKLRAQDVAKALQKDSKNLR